MTFQAQLRIPGPTPLPERVVRSMSRPMIDHRGPEFAAILAEITAGAKRVFKTSSDLVLLTSSGTGGLESAIANLVSPGDEVVAARYHGGPGFLGGSPGLGRVGRLGTQRPVGKLTVQSSCPEQTSTERKSSRRQQ